MDASLEERDWALLLRRIADGKCTPIIGPDIVDGFMPHRRDIAQSWANQHDYPLDDVDDIARVAQYLAIRFDPYFPKDEIHKQLTTVEQPDFHMDNQPHGVLADLELPIYLTTNFDDFMFQALKSRNKDPKVELCRWNDELARSQMSHLDQGYNPTPANPLVYHLLGQHDYPESLVLTEDDYLNFLVNITTETYKLPPRIQRALAGSSILLLGFNPLRPNFRILFRSLMAATDTVRRPIGVTVQLPPLADSFKESAREKVQAYLTDYFDQTSMRVYWGTTKQFINELHQRWQQQEKVSEGEKQSGQQVIDLKELYDKLVELFNKNEMMTLAFGLGVDYESLPAAKDAFARELIVYLQRRKRLHEMIATCRQERPSVVW